jgi:hypothetical protein
MKNRSAPGDGLGLPDHVLLLRMLLLLAAALLLHELEVTPGGVADLGVVRRGREGAFGIVEFF